MTAVVAASLPTTSAAEETTELGPPASLSSASPGPPLSLTPAAGAPVPAPTSASSPGTSCDEPPKLVPLSTGDEDAKMAAVTSQRAGHAHGARKRRASGDSHEVI